MTERPYVLTFKSSAEINGSRYFEIRTKLVREPISNEPGLVWIWFELISNYFESNFLRTQFRIFYELFYDKEEWS